MHSSSHAFFLYITLDLSPSVPPPSLHVHHATTYICGGLCRFGCALGSPPRRLLHEIGGGSGDGLGRGGGRVEEEEGEQGGGGEEEEGGGRGGGEETHGSG